MREELKMKINELKKNTIIDSAERVFSRVGIEDATMDEISKEVGISKRTVYMYFSSKTNIFNAIFSRANKEIYETFSKEMKNTEVSSLNVRDKCEILWQTLKKFKEENNLYFRVVTMYENKKGDKNTEDNYLREAYEWSEKTHNIIKDIIKDVNSEYVNKKNIDEIVVILWMTSISILNIIDIKKLYLEEFFNIDEENFGKTFLNYITFPLLYEK